MVFNSRITTSKTFLFLIHQYHENCQITAKNNLWLWRRRRNIIDFAMINEVSVAADDNGVVALSWVSAVELQVFL